MDTLRDKVAVITGAASGIGRAIARALADQGAHIVAVDLDNDGIQALAGELSDQGPRYCRSAPTSRIRRRSTAFGARRCSDSVGSISWSTTSVY